MSLFKNGNGRTYEIIHQSGDYSLLQDVNTLQVVIAWALKDNSWGQGYYFDKARIKDAKNFYNKKVGFKAV